MPRVANWIFASLLVASLGLTLGCGGSSAPPSSRLPGKWDGKMIVHKESVGNSLTPLQIAELERMQMGIEFTKDGGMILSGVNNKVPYQSHGKWQKIGEEGDVLTIKSIESDGNQKDVVIIFEGNDAFSMPLKTEVANIGAMEFKRVR